MCANFGKDKMYHCRNTGQPRTETATMEEVQ